MTDVLTDWRAHANWDAVLLAVVACASMWGAAAMSRASVRRQAAERDSAEAARQTQAIVDHAADGIVTFGAQGLIESANQASAAMFGYASDELIGKPIGALLPALPAVAASQGAALDDAADAHFESQGRRQGGGEFPIELALTAVPHAGHTRHIVLIRDITERQRAQAAINGARVAAERSERFLRAITDNLPLRIAYVDRDLRYRFVNHAHCERFGLPREDILGRTRAELTGLPLPPQALRHIELVLQGQDQHFEFEEVQGGSNHVLETYLVADTDGAGATSGFYAASADATERHAQQRRIERALAERDILLREVYHRVKNNLQVIQSLLNLQRRALPEGLARTALDDSVQRVHAMALVHEKLYQTGHLDAVSLHDYTADLLRHLGDTAGAGRRRIAVLADVETIEASLEVSVPFGLLVTELVTNSFKHGFPPGRGGSIQVSLKRQDNAVWLSVRDNGLGLSPEFALERAASMGLQLAASLAGQLGGTLQAHNDGGAVFTAKLARIS